MKQISSFHYFISHIVVFSCIFHKQGSSDKFSCKKVFKIVFKSVRKHYFIEQISRTNYHRNLIDPLLEGRKFPPYCSYTLEIVVTPPSLLIVSFLQFP